MSMQKLPTAEPCRKLLFSFLNSFLLALELSCFIFGYFSILIINLIPRFVFFLTSSLNLEVFRFIDSIFLMKYLSVYFDRLSSCHYAFYMSVTLGLSLHYHSGFTFFTLLHPLSYILGILPPWFN